MNGFNERNARVAAFVASVVGTVLIGVLFWRPLVIVPGGEREDHAIEVVFIEAPRPLPSTPKRETKKAADHSTSVSTGLSRSTSTTDRIEKLANPIEPQSSTLSVADDTWTSVDAGAPKSTLFLSSQDRLVSRPEPDFEARPNRLHVRMKAPITVERVLREAGKALGLWPPGYTDDPCPGVSRLADYYRAHPPANSDLLQDALDLEIQCRKASPS